MIVARSQMGKTTLAVKLMSYTWGDQFDNIYIFCPTYAEDNTWCLFDKHLKSGRVEVFPDLNEARLAKLWNKVKRKKLKDPKYICLFYFDDCGGEEGFKTNSPNGFMNKFFIKCNHSNISVIYVVQAWTLASTIMRKNTEAFILFYPANEDEKNYFYKEFGRGEKREFMALVNESTKNPYDTFFVNRQGAGAPDFYHNFKKIKM